MERPHKEPTNLMDAHDKLIAAILTHYRTLMMLATIQAEGERTNEKPESIAVAGISMKMEFDGMYSSVKELLAQSRQMKELWVFGALGKEDPDRRAKESRIDSDVAKVASILANVEASNMRALAEECGGSWQPLSEGGGEVAQDESAAAPSASAAPTTSGARPTASM